MTLLPADPWPAARAALAVLPPRGPVVGESGGIVASSVPEPEVRRRPGPGSAGRSTSRAPDRCPTTVGRATRRDEGQGGPAGPLAPPHGAGPKARRWTLADSLSASSGFSPRRRDGQQ